MTTAKELMSSPAITVGTETPIQDLAGIMRKNNISGVPVVDTEGALLGLVTELNLIARNAPVVGPSYITILSGLINLDIKQYQNYREQLRQVLAVNAGELMSTDVEFIAPDADLETMMSLMEQPEIVQLPVVDNGRVIGVVTRTDLVRLIEKLEMAPEEPK